MIVLTGFPGFLGTRLVHKLAARHPDTPIRLLVQGKFRDKAQAEVARVAHQDVALLDGDITQAGLGLNEAQAADVRARTTDFWHLAAIYDLTVPHDLAWKVNVEGTTHVLDFLEKCPNLKRHWYISTCYVSGKRTGRILEDSLDDQAGFKNHYESTKHYAEREVRKRLDHVPTTIFRPAIVIGDSRTGETQKFDGPYFVMKFMTHLPRYSPMLRIGKGDKPVNLVPVDFVVEAMDVLATRQDNAGRTYQLADPAPLTPFQLTQLFASKLGKHLAYVSLPATVARGLMATGLGHLLGLSPELITYFDFDSQYDCANTVRDLEGTGVTCPPLPTYVDTMVAFLKQHLKDVSSKAMY
jgi:nucleoside-diphosphate-sugar epimerase